MTGAENRTTGISCPTVYFVRHGQSTWNLDSRVQGRSAAGVAAQLLGGGRIALLLSSDLTRTVQTAAIIGEALRLTPVVTPLLREQSLGALEGLTTRQATDALAGVDLTDPDRRYGGGESRNDVRDRVRHLLADPRLGSLAEGSEVALVSHGDTIRIAVADLLGDDPLAPSWRPIPNGAVTVIPGTIPAAGAAFRSACRGA